MGFGGWGLFGWGWLISHVCNLLVMSLVNSVFTAELKPVCFWL